MGVAFLELQLVSLSLFLLFLLLQQLRPLSPSSLILQSFRFGSNERIPKLIVEINWKEKETDYAADRFARWRTYRSRLDSRERKMRGLSAAPWEPSCRTRTTAKRSSTSGNL